MAMPDWSREYFELGYAQRWGLSGPSDRVYLEADGLCKLLHLAPTSRVIDIACGHGRHALVLAERGNDVIGVDFAVSLLNRARHLADGLHTRVCWVRGDMRQLPFRSELADAAILMDSLGFFETEQEHDAVLKEAARVLRIRGLLALKVVNGGPLIDGFRERDQEERDGAVISVWRTLTFDPPRMRERISISGSRGHGEYERWQRLYRVKDICAALEHTGFAVSGLFAGPDGAPFNPTLSSTMWIIGQRRAV